MESKSHHYAVSDVPDDLISTLQQIFLDPEQEDKVRKSKEAIYLWAKSFFAKAPGAELTIPVGSSLVKNEDLEKWLNTIRALKHKQEVFERDREKLKTMYGVFREKINLSNPLSIGVNMMKIVKSPEKFGIDMVWVQDFIARNRDFINELHDQNIIDVAEESSDKTDLLKRIL